MQPGIAISSCTVLLPYAFWDLILILICMIHLFIYIQIVLGVGVTYAAVPLYRMFCAATGFAGTPSVISTSSDRFDSSRLVPVEGAGRIRVHFNADRSETLSWKFFPQQKYVDVLPGESSLAFYKAKNESKKDVIGIATYNVTPDRVCWLLFGDMKVHLKLSGCTVLFQSGMFLFRGAKTPRGRGSRHASSLFHRQRHAR